MKIKPILDRVLLSPIKKEMETKSGIILGATSHERPELGEVVAIGSGDTCEGNHMNINLSIGNKVLFNKFAGTELSIENNEYIVIKYCDILAVLDKE